MTGLVLEMLTQLKIWNHAFKKDEPSQDQADNTINMCNEILANEIVTILSMNWWRSILDF